MEKKANLQEMSKKERIEFIWDYYKFWIIGGIIGIIAIISVVHHFMTVKETVAEMLLVNASTENEVSNMDEYLTERGYNPQKQEIIINSSFIINLERTDTTNVYTLQSLQTIIAADGADILAADSEMYQYLASLSSMADLRDFLSDDILEKYADNIFYVTDEDSGDTYPAGIIIPNNAWMVANGYYTDDCYIGILTGRSKSEDAAPLLLYILGESK